MLYKKIKISVIVATFATFLSCALSVWWIVKQADMLMREEFIKRAELVATAIDGKRCLRLAGTIDDLTNGNYLQLKKDLLAIHQATLQTRFIYLLGKKPDGTVVVLVDSEPADSKAATTLGAVYENPPTALMQQFASGISAVEGPYTDKMGSFVNANVPVLEPITGKVIALLCMAVTASNWHWELARRCALPVGLVVVLLIGAGIALGAAAIKKGQEKSLTRMLLPPFAAMVGILLMLGGVLFWMFYELNLSTSMERHLAEVSQELHLALKLQAKGLLSTAQAIASTPSVQNRLRDRDMEGLLAEYAPVFQKLKKENSITHFYLLDKNRYCLLRFHQPTKSGDFIDRFTAWQAEQTGESVVGLELGVLGNLVLRAICPVFEGANHVGYVELGTELQDLLKTLPLGGDTHWAILIHKDALHREGWETGRKAEEKRVDWDRLPQCVVTYASQGYLPDAFALQEHITHQGENTKNIAFEGKEWQMDSIPLQSMPGKHVGALLLFTDVSQNRISLAKGLVFGGLAGGVVLCLLLWSIYVLLRRSDRSIVAQRTILSESEERYRRIFEGAQDGLMTIDPSAGCFIAYNTAFQEMFCATPSTDFSKLRLWDLSPEYQLDGTLSREKSQQFLDLAMRTGTYFFHWQHKRLNGEEFPATVLLTKLEIAGRSLLLATLRDMTESQTAAEKNRYLLQALEHSPALVVITNRHGIIEYVNARFQEVTGYTKEEALGKKTNIMKSGTMDPQIYVELWDTILAGNIWHGELQNKKKNGGLFWESLTISSIRSAAGIITHFVALKEDITEQKVAKEKLVLTNQQLQLALEQAREMTIQAENANIAKSEFLANMSHEIRTPMNGVIGMTGLLIDSNLTNQQRRYAETVKTSGEALLLLINDILDFSKIEAGKLDIEVLDFDLTSLLEDLADSTLIRANEKGLEIVCAIEPAVPPLLRGDPGRLRQILTNLIGNAIKFTLEGEVVIRVRCICDMENEVFLRFSIKDTGIGIPHEKIGMLFEKFTQADASTTRNYGGTGLGLAISKQLVELMGGEIGITSEVGKGSEFWFSLRLPKQSADSSMHLPPADLKDIRVLIVDNNATNREILMLRLAAWGMRPVAVASGAEALPILWQAIPDNDPFRIAILDMQMPGMNGEELGKTIRADARLNDLRMVILTSMGTHGDAKHFQDIGFAAYTTKPFRQEELKNILSLALKDWEVTKTAPKSIITRHTVREATPHFAGSKARILLAEDHIINQQVALGILKNLGLSADPVANGQEALYALETIRYDLILMDMQMPEMDGMTATREIRKQEEKRRLGEKGDGRKYGKALSEDAFPKPPDHIIIIAMTANAMKGDREVCLKAGMDDYVAKPVSARSLVGVLEKWLPKAKEDFAPILMDVGAASGEPEESRPMLPGSFHRIPVFDYEDFKDRLEGDATLMESMTQGFLKEIPIFLADMRKALSRRNTEEIRAQAHKIKGVSGNVSAERLCAIAEAMETASGNEDLVAALDLMNELEETFVVLQQAMEKKP